jgi:PBP1b-binding outer membrane lipoprotein LpoB
MKIYISMLIILALFSSGCSTSIDLSSVKFNPFALELFPEEDNSSS